MDREVIKNVLDKFEADEYVDAKEMLTNAIRQDRDEYLKNKLSLKDNGDE